MTRNIYVEKNADNAIEANAVLRDLVDNLGVKNLTGVRVVNRYGLFAFSEADFKMCAYTVFAEPTVDALYDGEKAFAATIPTGAAVFCVSYLPGQFDQRADSARQCAEAVTGKECGIIVSAKVYVLEGLDNGGGKIEKIKGYLINPVDSESVDPYTVSDTEAAEQPRDVGTVDGFTAYGGDELRRLLKDMGLAMTLADLECVREYFKSENRDPTVTEIRVLDTYWSDHCRHTTFLTELTDINIEDESSPVGAAYREYLAVREEVFGGGAARPVTLMDLATIGAKALKKRGLIPDLDESEEVNACGITADIPVISRDGETIEKYLILFKNETHNHPTEIEPFGGAATCLGGAIRDPLSGRAYVYQAMRVTGGSDPTAPVSKTLPGKLPPRKITIGAAHGYSSYGNQIGIPTGIVREIFDGGYMAKRMEIGAVVGAVKYGDIRRERPEAGDVVVLIGGRTGRDGCGGATGSSKEHTEESIRVCGAEVQKGNAPTERKLQRFFRDKRAQGLIKRCNDFGAGGVAVAVGELADGLYINLDCVLKKYEGLDGTELAISESQERMAVVCAAADAAELSVIAASENLEAAVIAQVTGAPRLCMAWRGKRIVNISREFLNTNGARQYAEVFVRRAGSVDKETDKDVKTRFLDALASLNVCSQKGLCERFDGSIGAGSVLMPFGGKNQLTPAQAMAALIPVQKENGGYTDAVTIMSFGCDIKTARENPFLSAARAVVESVSKIAAAGGKWDKARLTFQEYFERLGSDPQRWGKPFSALLGAFHAQMKLGIPAIGGKDSMSGSFKDLNVPPTLVSFALCVGSAKNVISPEFKRAGNSIVYIKTNTDKDGLPDFDVLARNLRLVEKGIAGGAVVSAYAVGTGGIAASCAQMAFGNGFGFNVEYDESIESDMFSPSYGSFVLEVSGGAFSGGVIGAVTENTEFVINGVRINHEEALEKWVSPLEGVFPTGEIYNGGGAVTEEPVYNGTRKPPATLIKSAKPRVFMPVFPGTNTEYDAAGAFALAGAEVDTFVLKNLTILDLRYSISEMAKRLKEAHILYLPGGFSAGDEPEGSGKFIAAVFRNPELREEVHELLHVRQGLALGICNGAQALMKLGLAAYGEIRDIEPHSPTLTFNAIGRHVSKICRTKVMSNISPWLSGTNVGDIINVAVSHGEGRFAAGSGELARLVENGQIASCYVDLNGRATMDQRYNPNGSALAAEGITSPDGRVFAKMGHNERWRGNIFKNVPGNYDSKIFESGVKYFS